jgi:hypothetical protein
MLKRAVLHTRNQFFILDSARLQTHAAGTDFRLAPEEALRPAKGKILNKIKYM